MKPTRIILHCCLLELGIAAAAGYFAGRYFEREKLLMEFEEDAEKGNDIPKPNKKKRSITYQDGKVIIDISRR